MRIKQKMKKGLNRLWILFSFIPYINGLGLIFVGKRSNKNSWYYTGLTIEILWFFLIFLINLPNPTYYRYPGDSISSFSGMGAFTIIISIIVTFYIRSKYEKLLEEDKYIKCKEPSISLLCGVLAATPYLNCIPFIYYGTKFHKSSFMIEGIIYEIPWILSLVNGQRQFVVFGLALILVSFMRFIVINYSNPYFSYSGDRKHAKKEEKPKNNIPMNQTRPKVDEKEILKDNELKIHDLASEFDKKEEKVSKIIENRFSENSLTYTKFMKVIKNANENFHLEKKSALEIIEISKYHNNPNEKLREKIKNLEKIIEKIDDLSIELTINNPDNSNSEKFDELLKDMDDLINSVKHYK